MIVNSKLYGHDKVWHNLVNDYLTNHLPHAYIFAGAKAIGKEKTAREYIKYIIKANDMLAERVDEGSFLDLLYISRQDKNEIGIDSIRKASDFLKHTPAEGEYKFIIIDSADDLNLNAANALLKVLEEPTKNTIFFLISHNPKKLLSTIRSRCRIVKFSPLAVDTLKLIAPISGITRIEDFIAGSAGKAIKTEQAIELYEKLLSFITDFETNSFNKFAEDVTKSLEKWELVKDLLLYFFSHCIKLQANAIEKSKLNFEIHNIAERKSLEDWYKIYDEFINSSKQAEIFNLDKKQLLFLTIKSIS